MKRGPAGPTSKAYCGGMSGKQRKVRHRTLDDAKRFRAWFMDKTGEEYVRIYKCPVCKGYPPHDARRGETKQHSLASSGGILIFLGQ